MPIHSKPGYCHFCSICAVCVRSNPQLTCNCASESLLRLGLPGDQPTYRSGYMEGEGDDRTIQQSNEMSGPRLRVPSKRKMEEDLCATGPDQRKKKQAKGLVEGKDEEMEERETLGMETPPNDNNTNVQIGNDSNMDVDDSLPTEKGIAMTNDESVILDLDAHPNIDTQQLEEVVKERMVNLRKAMGLQSQQALNKRFDRIRQLEILVP